MFISRKTLNKLLGTVGSLVGDLKKLKSHVNSSLGIIPSLQGRLTKLENKKKIEEIIDRVGRPTPCCDDKRDSAYEEKLAEELKQYKERISSLESFLGVNYNPSVDKEWDEPEHYWSESSEYGFLRRFKDEKEKENKNKK